MPEVAVVSAVVMILKPHKSTGMTMAGAIEARRIRWCSISGIHPEGIVTVTNGGRAGVQGRGRLAREGSIGAAEAGTWDDGGGPQTAIVTVTDFVTGVAKFRVPVQPLTDRFRSVTATAHSPHLTVALIWECGVVLPYRTTLFESEGSELI